MSYTALYRKFRPDNFEDVKGQDHIVTTLTNQINANRIGHAYLFCGTRGTGKTTVAKILAKAVNCEHPVNGSPCNECEMCKAIQAGTSMNVIEIDAASNNGVDNIREIREEVTYRPTEGRYKVYIIDEVHMLSTGAFNALLKTLEEPPSYVIFILATTEAHKIPITILSRCQRYDFHRISIDTIAARLSELLKVEALKTAETKKREALLEVKEESLRTKNELEKETKERRSELQKYERRVLSKEESVDKKADAVEKREAECTAKVAELQKREKKVDELEQKGVQELERISGLTSDQAKDELLRSVEDDVKVDVARMYKELENRAKEEAGKKAKEYVVNAIQKCAVDHVAETTISVVQLPSDEMKGRIIGREGRNIRTLETLTGVDLIIDDTPEAVVLSAFDPIRREIARVALEKLIVDGRIHPARIEEMVEKAQKEVETQIREDGENAAMDVGVHGIHPELLKLLGRMKFRSSYGQNALKHSIEVAQLSGILAGEIGVDVRMAKRAGLLHDIGKSIDHEVEGSHIQIGVDLCKKYKESAVVINTVASHHGDVEPESLVACIVQAADAISAARPGARRETLETYTNRLKQLEDITNEFKGVDKSFAIQAGREIRVMVVPEQVTDADMVLLARDISKQIEAELEYPGQIKVNVIRESRAVDYAK